MDAVLFDIDDTLCQYRRPGEELLAAAFEATETEPFFTVDEYYGRYREFVDDSDSMTNLRVRRFAAIAAEFDRDPAAGGRSPTLTPPASTQSGFPTDRRSRRASRLRAR